MPIWVFTLASHTNAAMQCVLKRIHCWRLTTSMELIVQMNNFGRNSGLKRNIRVIVCRIRQECCEKMKCASFG